MLSTQASQNAFAVIGTHDQNSRLRHGLVHETLMAYGDAEVIEEFFASKV